MLNSAKTLMLVGLLMLLPIAADAAVVEKTPELTGGRVARSPQVLQPILGRGPGIDPNGSKLLVR